MTDNDLEVFYNQYVETALWSSTADGYNKDENDDTSFQSHNFDESDLADECRERMIEDCKSFMEESWDFIKGDISQAGHDFWLTRNGHGAGFWDGDWKSGDKLTEMSKSYGSVYLYYNKDDEKIYQS